MNITSKDISSHRSILVPLMIKNSQPSLLDCYFFYFFLSVSSSPSAQIFVPPLLHAPGFNEVVDGGVHLFLLDQVVSPGLLQFHHLAGKSQTGQLHRYGEQEGTNLAHYTLNLTTIMTALRSTGYTAFCHKTKSICTFYLFLIFCFLFFSLLISFFSTLLLFAVA